MEAGPSAWITLGRRRGRRWTLGEVRARPHASAASTVKNVASWPTTTTGGSRSNAG